jgi:hypothetical protein
MTSRVFHAPPEQRPKLFLGFAGHVDPAPHMEHIFVVRFAAHGTDWYEDVMQWLGDEFGTPSKEGRWFVDEILGCYIFFLHEKDAMHFKLRWVE